MEKLSRGKLNNWSEPVLGKCPMVYWGLSSAAEMVSYNSGKIIVGIRCFLSADSLVYLLSSQAVFPLIYPFPSAA